LVHELVNLTEVTEKMQGYSARARCPGPYRACVGPYRLIVGLDLDRGIDSPYFAQEYLPDLLPRQLGELRIALSPARSMGGDGGPAYYASFDSM
jgi:hypothetical protein